ncbi:hypothetical protein P170DRAFT_374210 [Aspergillus steynii IBT 23096]|uniref:Uncharacterized protein n=1 Tax=Aspergillus steynii IBT 23096 TaxID=1392250 RepID=A0A2I2GPL8_9EURO|nr:uncharacterized protein P170DRAFT_374210 [Aspergillus steynii IBT 23096]PLB54816.1 hypothetical protein P170DRAFT_374210 [Aspergillus steynii IBT 23096]
MRPALLRLLKRPSALSVLDSLISIPLGIEELESKYKGECLRYNSRAASQKIEDQAVDHERPDHHKFRTRPSPYPSSFRVYDIQSPQSQATNGSDRTRQPQAKSSNTGPPREVGLQLEKLEYESDIGHTDGIGTRLVDDPARRHDFALWEELLRYRQRHYGDKGTHDIWEGLMVRVDDVQLPVRGDRADFFWQSFVDLALKRTVLLNELVNYAFRLWKETGNRWDKLYEAVVGGLIARGMPQQALEWHKKLQHPHLSEPNDILRILQLTIAPRHQSRNKAVSKSRHTSTGLWVFQNICRSTKGHRIYAPVISTLLRNGLTEDLSQTHQALIAQDDHPESYEDIQPLLEYAEENWPRFRFQKLNVYVESRFPGRAATTKGGPTTKEPQPDKEPLHERKPFKDELGARLFATRALNFEMILSGLRMFGVSAIGPQTVREMAVRAHGGQDILEKLRQLQAAGISVGDSVFTRLVRKLASEHREVLLSDFISSDQHFEMLEDVAAQESLLVSYYVARDWRQYNMTLAILAEISTEGPDLSNIHFRKFIAADEWRFASKFVDDMTLQGRSLSKESIDFMVKHILPARQPGHMPQQLEGRSLVKEMAFVVQILQRAAKSGTAVPSKLWIEMLKRLGMLNRWYDLRDCCLWLARQHSPAPKHAVGTSSSASQLSGIPSSARGQHLLQTIFTGQMQAAIVSWGFKMRISHQAEQPYAAFGPEQEGLIPWVRGLVLLRELEQHGVQLHVGEIRQTCRQRLKVIFGPAVQSSRRMNRMLRRENPYSVERVIGDINRVWGEPSLFGGREHVDLFRLINPAISPMSLRRMSRNPRQRRAASSVDEET